MWHALHASPVWRANAGVSDTVCDSYARVYARAIAPPSPARAAGAAMALTTTKPVNSPHRLVIASSSLERLACG